MKQLVAIWMSILFITGSLFPGTDVEEVYKLPKLVSHYLEHKAQANADDFDFMDYIKLHYGFLSEHARAVHSESEANLPMYKHLCTGLTFIVPSPFVFDFRIVLLPDHFKANYQENYRFLYSTSFLQPPRCA